MGYVSGIVPDTSPMSYYMSIQPAASLTKIGLAAPASTLVGILLNVIFFLYFNKKINNRQ